MNSTLAPIESVASGQNADVAEEPATTSSCPALFTKKTVQYVYLLVSSSGSTYVGATMDLNRRLRQHNKEIVGGAKATGSKVARGETWRRHCYVSGFPDWSAALQFEWRWKQISRRIQSAAPRSSRMSPLERRMSPVERRMLALDELLAMERPTSKAVAYAEWDTPPEVHIEPSDVS
jgi:structure-specific endonuclease subunit SLX1